MKSLALGLTLMLGTTASAQCLNTNGDMETFTAPITAGNNWINNELTNWNVSHGDPSIGTTPSTNIWMWSYWHHSGYQRGEGVYTEYSFVSGQTYTLCYDLWRDANSNPVSTFRAELANGLTPYFGGGPSWAFSAATPSSTQPLTTQPWVNTGSWVTITETFTANANYDQLWLYPMLTSAPNPDQAACRIDNVCIKQDIPVDPCDFEPKFSIQSSIDGCSMIFKDVSAYPADPGFTVLDVSWTFGDGTSGNGSMVTHYYDSPGVYNVCMTVWTTNGEECCKKTYCRKVEFESHCDPCELIHKVEMSISGSGPVTLSAINLPAGVNYGYLWDFGDGTTGTGQTVTHSYSASGSYEVCLTVFYYDPVKEECCSVKICKKIEVEASQVKSGKMTSNDVIDDTRADVEYPVSTLTIFPNPSQGLFTLELEGEAELNEVVVYDLSGKKVFQSELSSGSTSQLDLSSLEKGTYLIIVNERDEQNRKFDKIIIE